MLILMSITRHLWSKHIIRVSPPAELSSWNTDDFTGHTAGECKALSNMQQHTLASEASGKITTNQTDWRIRIITNTLQEQWQSSGPWYCWQVIQDSQSIRTKRVPLITHQSCCLVIQKAPPFLLAFRSSSQGIFFFLRWCLRWNTQQIADEGYFNIFLFPVVCYADFNKTHLAEVFIQHDLQSA